jgi:DUF2075 family protein
MRIPLKKKKGKQRKEHAVRSKNKQFGPKKNKKDSNEKSKIV